MSAVTFLVTAPHGATAERPLASCLTAGAQDDVRREANQWIKRLRLVPYDGQTMRQRFRYRGDSLWWFTELYLHKMRQLDRAIETILALEHLVAAESPTRIAVRSSDAAVLDAAAAFGAARRVAVDVARVDARRRRLQGFLVGSSALLSRWRRSPSPIQPRPPRVAAFVHTAFWREAQTSSDGGRESYIGPVLDALGQRLAPDDLRCIGVGPRRNFRQRRWWDPIVGRDASPSVTPIEQLAPRAMLTEALDFWRQRESLAAAIVAGPAIREAGVWRDYDLWPVLAAALADAARVQWPWSARSMDEARAALLALRPGVVVTYAEAGGWGRALALEARRAGVPSVGVQHGFIYRHWLNYQHEADEMKRDGDDLGFPRPDRTLVFDLYAAHTLEGTGHFPPDALRVTGSPRLDELAGRTRSASAERTAVRERLGVSAAGRLVVVAAKFIEIRDELPALVDAVNATSGVRCVIKPHPAEPAAVYQPLLTGQDRVVVTGSAADLGELLAVADALVTMNSTVAVDALVIGVPALVVGLPNNLSPFVEAGVMIGADRATLGARLETLLYDAEGRAALLARGAAFAREHAMASDGQAPMRAADAILELTRPHKAAETRKGTDT